MADVYTATADAVPLVAATAKTVMQLTAPATTRARIRELQICFDGVTASNPPGLVEILTQTTAGTATVATPAPADPAAPASLITASRNATVEPTAGTVLQSWRISPNGGVLLIPFPTWEEQLVLAASGRIGVRCTFAQAVNVNVSLTFLV